MQPFDSLSVLEKSAWFTSLPTVHAQKLLIRSSQVNLKEGEVVIYQEDDDTEALYCVLSGVMRVSTCSPTGKEAVLTYLAPGAWFGEISIFDRLQRTHTAQAHEDTCLLRIGRAELMQTLETSPDLYPYVINLFCEKMRLLLKVIDDRNLHSSQAQLAWRLLMLAESFGVQSELGVEIKLRLPQEDLAQMLGISRQSINKLLRQLEDARLIFTQYRHVIITDIEKMKQLIP